MREEENVYVETNQTEDVAAAKRKGEKDASTVLGKFKDVDALAQAYGALEAEFTRRSQRLKELEREAENFRAKKNGEGSGVEKLRKNAAVKREQARAFDAFVAEVNDVAKGKNAADDIEGEPVKTESEEIADEDFADCATKTEDSAVKSGTEDGDETAAVNVTTAETGKTEERTATAEGVVGTLQEGVLKGAASVAEKTNGAFSSEELYRLAVKNEDVRLKIIGEYLSSLGKSGAPLTASGVGTIAAPPIKARTVGDAGAMALRYFKKGATE